MHVDTVLPYRVSPFGNLRIDAYVPLPEAYRSLSRPSSAPDAKAFPLRSFSLNLLVLKNYAGSIRFFVCRNCYPFCFHNCFKLLPSVALLVLCSLFSFQCADGDTKTVPSKLNNAKSEHISWPDLRKIPVRSSQTRLSLERR